MKPENFQSRTRQTIDRLCNQSNASARFDRSDETRDAIVFFDDLRRAVQRRKQLCNPCVMLWIVRPREGNETLFGDLFQPNSTFSRQWMRRIHGHTNWLTLQFLENQSRQSFRRHLHQQGHVELSLTQSAQHFLRGQIMKLHAHARVGLPEIFQRARQKFDVNEGA